MADECNSNPADTVAFDADIGAQSAVSTCVPSIPVAPMALKQGDVVVAHHDDNALRPIVVGKDNKNGWPLILLPEVKPIGHWIVSTDNICLVISDHSIVPCFVIQFK